MRNQSQNPPKRLILNSFFSLALGALFFCSGCSALIYQLAWQRMLFTLFGVDLEAITIIVSIFMFGLGLGGLWGGILADLFVSRLLGLYVAIEVGIAAFGFYSPSLINGLAQITHQSSELSTALGSFLILALPTILMGATFPILVTQVNKTKQHIGQTAGELYFANTLGAVTGAYLSGFVLLSWMGLEGMVHLAALLNLLTALVTLIFFRGRN